MELVDEQDHDHILLPAVAPGLADQLVKAGQQGVVPVRLLVDEPLRVYVQYQVVRQAFLVVGKPLDVGSFSGAGLS